MICHFHGGESILCWKYLGSFSKLNQFHISQSVSIYVCLVREGLMWVYICIFVNFKLFWIASRMKYQILFFNRNRKNVFCQQCNKIKIKTDFGKTLFPLLFAAAATVISIAKTDEIDYLSDQNRNSIWEYVHEFTMLEKLWNQTDSNKFSLQKINSRFQFFCFASLKFMVMCWEGKQVENFFKNEL